MKFNQFYSSPIPLYKYVLVSLLCIIYFPLSANTINVDSLKSILKKSNKNQEDCTTIYKIYNHYNATGEVDSMNAYAKHAITRCDLSKKDNALTFWELIRKHYKQGFADNIIPSIDSLILMTNDPDLKLQLLVRMSDTETFYNNQETFNKYWSQAEKAITYAKDDYSKYLYYNILGYKHSGEGNIFAALQSLKLASTFVDKNGQEFLKNNSDLANIYLLIGEIEKAKDIYIDLLKRAKEDKHRVTETYIGYSLMDCYIRSDDHHTAINVALESIERCIKYNLNVPEGYSYNIIGLAYLALYNMDSVNKSTDKILMDDVNIPTSYLDSTKHYLDQGVAFSIKNNDSNSLAGIYATLSDYYKTIGNYEQAKLYLVKAQKVNSYYDYAEIDKILAELWVGDNNYNKAYFHLDKYINHKSQKEKNGKKDLALATKIIEDSYKYKEESQANLLMAKQKEERLRNLIALTLAGLFLIALLLMYVQRNRKKLEVLNSEINKQNKELAILINKQKETIKYLDNFASVAAHDLKAPITTAIGFAETLAVKAEGKLDERHKTYLSYIISNVFKLSTMIDNLLSLSRLDIDLPEAKQVDLNDTIAQVELSLTNLLNEKGASIVVESSLPKIVGHATLMSQLFQNIIKNAIVHNKTGEDTIVKISSESSNDDMYTIKISDNSGGIPDFIVPTMFDLFSSSDKNSGNGIGLASCKKIVNHYGGEIWVDVDAGIGSTFNFNLPISN